jgi:hypothetical protein
MKRKLRKWTPLEIKTLKKYYTKKGAGFVAEKLKRKLFQVYNKATLLDLRIRERQEYWEEKEVAYLKKWYGKKPVKAIAAGLKRTPKAVARKAEKFNLRAR